MNVHYNSLTNNCRMILIIHQELNELLGESQLGGSDQCRRGEAGVVTGGSLQPHLPLITPQVCNWVPATRQYTTIEFTCQVFFRFFSEIFRRRFIALFWVF